MIVCPDNNRFMPRLISALVRHCQYDQKANTPSAHQPYALTDQGRLTAQREAENLGALLGMQRLETGAYH